MFSVCVCVCYLQYPVLDRGCARGTQPRCHGVGDAVLRQQRGGGRVSALALLGGLTGDLAGDAQFDDFLQLDVADL